MATTLNYSEISSIETPVLPTDFTYDDANEELQPIAEFIKQKTIHNEYIMPGRIKFLYSSKLKKEGGRYTIGSLVKRDDMEKMINDDYDFIVFVSYKIWKELDVENKVIQLDKILSGIDTGTNETPKLTKKQADSKEFVSNMRFFGPEKVLNSSEAVHLACERIVEKEKEAKKNGGVVEQDENEDNE